MDTEKLIELYKQLEEASLDEALNETFEKSGDSGCVKKKKFRRFTDKL